VVGEDQVEPAAQQLRARLRGLVAPAGKRRVRRFDRMFGVGSGAAWRVADAFCVGRVVNGEARTIRSVPPFAVDQRLLPEQGGVS